MLEVVFPIDGEAEKADVDVFRIIPDYSPRFAAKESVNFWASSLPPFSFVNVDDKMDCRKTTRDGEPVVEWTWDGNDEMDPAQGRGWAVVKVDELHGMIFLHQGDDSDFVAKKGQKRATR